MPHALPDSDPTALIHTCIWYPWLTLGVASIGLSSNSSVTGSPLSPVLQCSVEYFPDYARNHFQLHL